MNFPKEYINYLVHFHGTRDYFECHEILEEYWKAVDPRNLQSHWVGFILLAVSAYHHRRKNLIGAEKTSKKALRIFQHTPMTTINDLGLDYDQLLQQLGDKIQQIQAQRPYKSWNLPIADDELFRSCQQQCEQHHWQWRGQIEVPDEIIHRHMLRDRSDVIREREHQKSLRISQAQILRSIPDKEGTSKIQ